MNLTLQHTNRITSNIRILKDFNGIVKRLRYRNKEKSELQPFNDPNYSY